MDLPAGRDLERGVAALDRRAGLAGLDARVAFLAVVGLAFGFGLAFAAAGRLAGLAFAAALVRAAAFGLPRAAGLVFAGDFRAVLARDLAAGRATVFRLVAGLAVALFRAAIPVLKSARAACPLGRRSIWRRPFGSKPKREKPHNPLKIKELQRKYQTMAGH